MDLKLLSRWESLRANYWFIPAVMSVGAVVLAFVMLEADSRLGDKIPLDAWWIYGGGAEGARAMLAAIVSSMISVTSVVFSITIVALTLASGQFGPRLLRTFMRDRANQMVLGTFIATFIYAVLIMRAVQGVEERAFVPPLAVTVGILLVITSVGVLIFFIHHIALSIQADEVVSRISKEIAGAIERLYPDVATLHPEPPPERPIDEVRGQSAVVAGPRDGYIQGIDIDRLIEVAKDRVAVIVLLRRPGDFMVRGGDVARVHPAEALDDDFAERIRDSFVAGSHRTLTQDAEFGFLQLVEVAVRALSPGINDPFTATTCIDHLSAQLRRLAQRDFPPRDRYDDEGTLRVVADTSSFTGFVNAAFDQIRQNARGSVAVHARLLEGLTEVARGARTEEQRAVLLEHVNLVRETAEAAGIGGRDMADLLERHAAALRLLAVPGRAAGLQPAHPPAEA